LRASITDLGFGDPAAGTCEEGTAGRAAGRVAGGGGGGESSSSVVSGTTNTPKHFGHFTRLPAGTGWAVRKIAEQWVQMIELIAPSKTDN